MMLLGLMVGFALGGEPSGPWDLSGRDLNGEVYTGSAFLQPWGPALDVTWQTSIGEYQGMALLHEGRLYASWGAGPGFGIATYAIGEGRLEGAWGLWRDRNTPGLEQGTPVGRVRRGLVGTWEVEGHAPGAPARTYSSTLTIEKVGRTYALTWEAENSTYRGVGFRHGEVLVVGWSSAVPGGLVEYKSRRNGETYRGRWAVPGERQRGRETLRRR